MVYRLVFFTFTVIVSAANASSCKDVRLDDPGKPFSKMPVLNQGKTDLCYAFVAKQMIEYYLLSHGKLPGDIPDFSVLQIAANSKIAEENSDKLSIGFAHNSINGSVRNGLCKNASTELKIDPADLTEFIEFIERDRDVQQKIESLRCENKTSLPYYELLSQISPLLNSKYAFLRMYAGCKDRLYLKEIPEATWVYHQQKTLSERTRKITSTIQKQLNQPNPQPVSVAFCWNTLYNKNTSGIINATSYSKAECVHDLHVALVIGQKEVNGKCQFLIRNSKGISCEGYDWPCEKETGQIWVDSEVLTRNTFQTSVIGNQ